MPLEEHKRYSSNGTIQIYAIYGIYNEMKAKYKWGLVIIGTLFSLAIVLPTITYYVFATFYLSPDRLKTLAETEAAHYIQGSLQCDSVRLTYWETWPSIGIEIQGIKYKNSTDIDSTSMLQGSIDRLVVFFNVIKYVQQNKLEVTQTHIDNPIIYARLYEGKSLNILKDNVKLSKTQWDNLTIKMEYLTLHGGNILLEQPDKQTKMTWYDIDLSLEGMLSTQNNYASLKLKGDSCQYISPQYSIQNNSPFYMQCNLSADLHNKTLRIKKANILFDQIPFFANGICSFAIPNQVNVDLSFSLAIRNLQDFLGYLPKSYVSSLSTYHIEGKTSMEGSIKGIIGNGLLPSIDIEGKLSEGALRKKNKKYGIDTGEIDFRLICPANQPDSSLLEIKQLNFCGLDSYIYGTGVIKYTPSNPFIDLQLKSDIDFNHIGEALFNDDKIKLSGNVSSDIELVFRLNDLQKGNYERIWANGSFEIEHLQIECIPQEFYLFITKANASIGYKQNQSRFILQREILSASAQIDSLNFRFGKQMQMLISDFSATTNTSLPKDTNNITPLTLHLDFRHIQTRIQDHIALLASNAEWHAGIKPSDYDKRSIVIATAFSADSIEYFDIRNQQATRILDSRFISELFPNDPLHWNLNFNPHTFFQQWDTKGILTFSHIRSFSQHLPLRFTINATQLGFRNNELILDKAQMKLGSSDFLVSGKLLTEKLPNAHRRFVKGNLNIQSHFLDINELNRALWQGEVYSKQNQRPTTSIDFLNLGNLDEIIHQAESSTAFNEEQLKRIIYIPDNLDLSLSFAIDEVRLDKFSMEDANGSILLKNKKAFCNFSTRTDVGNTRMEVLYDTADKNNASAYVDWDMEHIHIGKLKQFFPTLPILFPMTNSLEGIVDCQLTALCPLDSSSAIDLTGLYAACSFKGSNMVLFSNETFHQIANKFRFKDKKRNLLEDLSVDFIVKNQNIEIFPFIIKIDRYSFITSGKHRLDMTYDYHVDVLDSPIPFNFGLDVSGQNGNFQYKPVFGTQYGKVYANPLEREKLHYDKYRRLNEIRASIRKALDTGI